MRLDHTQCTTLTRARRQSPRLTRPSMAIARDSHADSSLPGRAARFDSLIVSNMIRAGKTLGGLIARHAYQTERLTNPLATLRARYGHANRDIPSLQN